MDKELAERLEQAIHTEHVVTSTLREIDLPGPPIYIAGPMSGLPQSNFPAFFEAERVVQEEFPFSEIMNPARMDVDFGDTDLAGKLTSDLSDQESRMVLAHFMERDIPCVVKAEIIVLLPGWEASPGVTIELAVARATGTHILEIGALLNGG